MIAAPELSTHFEGLAHPTRLAMVRRLSEVAEMRVSQLAALCKVSQPRASWHLRILRRAHVVLTRREGREVFIRLDRDSIAAHLRSFSRYISFTGPAETAAPLLDTDGGAEKASSGAPPRTEQTEASDGQRGRGAVSVVGDRVREEEK